MQSKDYKRQAYIIQSKAIQDKRSEAKQRQEQQPAEKGKQREEATSKEKRRKGGQNGGMGERQKGRHRARADSKAGIKGRINQLSKQARNHVRK